MFSVHSYSLRRLVLCSPKDFLIARLTLEPTCRQIALRMDATSPFPAIKRSDASDLARYPKMTESLVSLGKSVHWRWFT